jgi:predicted MFS family arabinose efflux permease
MIIDLYSSFNAKPEFYFLMIRLLLGTLITVANIAVYTSIASFQNYERGYGLFVLMQYSLSGLGLYYLILYSDFLGVQGLYLSLAILDFIALLMVRSFPDLKMQPTSNQDSKSELKVLLTGATVFAVLGFGIHEMSGVAQFTYIERIGVAISIEDQSLSKIMLIASLLGIPGSMVCIVIGKRFGLLPPFLFGFLGCLLGMSLLIISKTYLTYTIRMCLMGFSWSLLLPYIQSYLASLDKKGSALAAGNSFATIGAAIGAALGANLVGQNSNYDGLLQVTILIYMVAASFFIISIKRRHSVHE